MHIKTETFVNQWFSASFVWKERNLVHIDLRDEKREPTAIVSAFGHELSRIIKEFADITTDSWPDLPLQWNCVTPFSRRVLEHLKATTPRGSWTTYGKLASACGSPRGARAVGSVMARNPWPLLFPCHRVLRGNAGLGGFGPGVALKQTLLSLEKAPLPR